MRYRFGDFILDTGTRQLIRDAADVHLSPKAFELLAILLANAPTAVSKAELQQRLWPTTFVEETNLASLVADIRRALRDPASSPVFVRTVYGFGYRFVGTVVVDGAVASAVADRARLHLVSRQGELMLMDGANVIGRGADATLRIESPGVSRHHARILVTGDHAVLEDVGSKNGTYLNGERISGAVPLSDGGEIRLGSVVLTFRVTSATSPTATLADERR